VSLFDGGCFLHVSAAWFKGFCIRSAMSSASLARNLRVLSTSAPARSVRVDRKVSRRGTCDRRIWTKSLAFAADAEELIFLYGFSMAVSPFDRLERSRSRIVAGGVLARRSLLSLKPGISQQRKKPTSSTR
jgi:hypothetical protein